MNIVNVVGNFLAPYLLLTFIILSGLGLYNNDTEQFRSSFLAVLILFVYIQQATTTIVIMNANVPEETAK